MYEQTKVHKLDFSKEKYVNSIKENIEIMNLNTQKKRIYILGLVSFSFFLFLFICNYSCLAILSFFLQFESIKFNYPLALI